ncbi:MAG: molybdopterin molybdotransferase MoeA [Eubacterium sp.]|nr:molybdopterin molybdotransferase MoeA [Eubacterium sp.]
MIKNYDEIIKLLTEKAVTMDTETVDIESAFGRVLAKDLVALENVPSFDRSPYDGYAFRAADTAEASETGKVRLEVIENIPAGKIPQKAVTKGTAVRLMTGAPIPEGADAVCKYEDTVFNENEVYINKSFKAGENVIYAGEDMKKGDLIVSSGSMIDAGVTGVMASLGMNTIEVYKKPKIGIISTGDEVTEIDDIPQLGHIRNSNRYTIMAYLNSHLYEVSYFGHVKDDKAKITEMILDCEKKVDVIISTGGVSAGDYDLVPESMEEAGYEILSDGVFIKPGMASVYGIKNGKMMFALSGNPASSLTNLQCICIPALRKISGLKQYDYQLIDMKLAKDFKNKSKNTRLIRGKICFSAGEVFLDFDSSQGNVVISSSVGCNAFGVIPPESGLLPAGTKIKGFLI